MPTTELLDVTSIYRIDSGDAYWMVQHNDNSDHGVGQHFFRTEDEAVAYAEDVAAYPPPGNDFHPAPDTLDIRVFYVSRR